MNIFNSKFNNAYDSKVSFVDSNNVVVDYDTEQCGCENADWFISDTICSIIPKEKMQISDLDGYQFDTSFFVESGHLEKNGYNALDAGWLVVFRMVNKDKEMFLHLYNCHNGCYSHCFDMKVGDSIIREGIL